MLDKRFRDERAAGRTPASAALSAGLTLWLCDPVLHRRHTLAAALAGALQRLDPPGRLIQADANLASFPASSAGSDGCDLRAGTSRTLALVAFEGEAPEPVLAGLRRLHEAGTPVVVYGDRCADWPLVQRCQVLLAGAPTVLDAAAPDFERRVLAEVKARIDVLTRQRCVNQRLDTVLDDLGIVGDSPPWRAALLAVERTARFTDVPVLLLGESGTGKDLLARAVHRLDQRRCRQPFVAVNCAALTKTLAEAELFGHRKGAYSGADRDRPGLLRAADGGVLFLDEIGDLDLEIQGKLLRVVQERRVLPLGDTHEIPIDVRIVAATHRDLKALVEQGRFREDLLNRLWVYPVDVPSLRHRRSDIPLLVHRFVRKCIGPGATPPAISPDFIEALASAQLVGNVRELEAIVQRAMVLHDEHRALTLAHLPPALWAELVAQSPPATPTPALEPAGSPGGKTPDPDLNLTRGLDQRERVLVEAALAASGGNQTHAARLLGITVRSLYTKLRKHGLVARAASCAP